ncbi:MAG TPA: DUF4440 domain-containing protein [Acidobacteriaceae bacterium]|jgi:hypothetical protein
MANRQPFTDTPPELHPVLDELRRLEPIFHSPEFGQSCADYERRMAPGYWEVGASGKRYSREFILESLSGKPPAFASALGWESCDYALRALGPETFLLTYALSQKDRITRRSTVWQNTSEGWRILYHQGTVVTEAADGTFPAK